MGKIDKFLSNIESIFNPSYLGGIKPPLITKSDSETNNDNESKNNGMRLVEFVGQSKVRNAIANLIIQAIENSSPLPSIILCGENGMGKSTLAKVISNEMNVNIKVTSGPAIERPGDLAGILTNLHGGDILFIDQINRLSKPVGEVLYPAIEEFALDIIIGKVPTERSIRLKLPKFTLIGSTTEKNFIDPLLQNSCGFLEFDPYLLNEIELIIKIIVGKKKLIEDDALRLIARSCERTPGKAKTIIKWINSYTDASSSGKITLSNVKEAINFFGIASDSDSIENIETKLKSLNGYQFEQFVASIFRKKGYMVRITKSTGDHGIDLILKKDGEQTAVQCKHWDKPVGEAIIRDFYGSIIGAKINNGIVITTTTFTTQAIIFTKNKPIELMDLRALKKFAS